MFFEREGQDLSHATNVSSELANFTYLAFSSIVCDSVNGFELNETPFRPPPPFFFFEYNLCFLFTPSLQCVTVEDWLGLQLGGVTVNGVPDVSASPDRVLSNLISLSSQNGVRRTVEAALSIVCHRSLKVRASTVVRCHTSFLRCSNTY